MLNKKRTLLVIEDYQPLRENIVDFLTISGFEVMVAKDGAEGVQKAISSPPDLIICDIQMPNLDGYQVFNSLQQIPKTSIIPFIFITAKIQLDEIRAGLQLGVDDYITKPFSFEDLLGSISKRLTKYDKVKASVDEKFKILLESPLNAAFVLIDGKISFGNAKFFTLLSTDPKSVANKKFDTFISEEFKELYKSQVDKCLINLINVIHIDLTLVNSKKIKIRTEFFAKHLLINDQSYFIGNIVETTLHNLPKKHTSEIAEYYNNNSEEIYNSIRNMMDKNIEIDEELIQLAGEFETARDNKVKNTIIASGLTVRELEVLKLICEGYTNTEIADKLFLSMRTVDNHRAHLIEKTNCKNTAHLVAFAIKNKLVVF